MSFKLQEFIVQKTSPLLRLDAVGIDISDRSVKFLKFSSTSPHSVEYWSECVVPAGVIENGEIKKESELAALLVAWLAKDKIKNKVARWAVASLPEEKSFLRIVQLPKIQREEIGNAIRWEIEANVPLPSEELIYDYEIIDGHYTDHLDLVISAFPKAIVESYTRVLRAAGFAPVALELESQAILRSILPMLQKKPTVVVDIGRTRTGLIIFSGSGIMYTTTVEFGGALLEQNIAKVMDVGPEEAMRIKKEKGFSKTEYDEKLIAALLPSLSALADELKRTIEYFHNHKSHAHGEDGIRQVILVGGDASLYGLDTYLSSALSIPVSIANPLSAMVSRGLLSVPSLHRRQDPAFSTASGLALRTSPLLTSYLSPT